jgi:hypothetical protein
MLEELCVSDVEGLLMQIDVPELQTHNLCAAQAGAVEQHQHRKQQDGSPRSFRRRVRKRRLQYPLYLLVRIEVGGAVMLTRCSSDALADAQDRDTGIEPVHCLRYDAAGSTSIEEPSGRGPLFAPVIYELIQRVPIQFEMTLQVAIEAQ